VYNQLYKFDAILPISAKTGDGVDELMNELEKYAEEGASLLPGRYDYRPAGAPDLRRACA